MIGHIVAGLRLNELYDQTILIVATDHGQGWVSNKRLPLLIHFPQDAYARRIQQSVQYLDIAPTLLDYLGIERPAWMAGRSMLQGELPQQPIFATYFENSGDTEPGNSMTGEARKTKGPRFQFVTMVYCNRWYRLDLASQHIAQGAIAGATAPCEDSDGLTDPEALKLFTSFLRENNFELSTP